MEIGCFKRGSTPDVFDIYRKKIETETTTETTATTENIGGTTGIISASTDTFWSDWDSCTAKCGSGTKRRSRLLSNGTEKTELIACNTEPCGKNFNF